MEKQMPRRDNTKIKPEESEEEVDTKDTLSIEEM